MVTSHKPRQAPTTALPQPALIDSPEPDSCSRHGCTMVNLQDAVRLYQLCCEHLQRERQHLEETREVLRQVYAAARSSKPQALADTLPRQQAMARATDEIRLARELLQVQAAGILGLAPGEVTLRNIARHLPATLGEDLLDRRLELRRIAMDTERLGRDITLFSHYFLDFLRRFFVQLTGGTLFARYGPEGQRLDTVSGSLLQAQG